ncbi:platelet-activating factor acetylhydrolase [Lanmaoa asiatica]|nr:platelet-activating factor acetylhydrolase [Lanmaoa asiatica]
MNAGRMADVEQSAVCGELVSRGYVVAAIEHRDGTAPSVRMTNRGGETSDFYWLNWTDLKWIGLDEQPMDDTTLRHVQLRVRLAEVEGVLQALQRLTQGQGLISTGLTSSLCEWEGWHAIEITKPIIAGHSFGGSLAIMAAADRRFNFSHVITFDPATRRLDPWDKTISMPLLAINSEEYASGDEFTKLLAIAPCAEMHGIYVIPGAMHPSFSDIFLTLPDYVNKWIGLAADPWHVVHQTIDTTSRFLDDEQTSVHHTAKCVDGLFLKDDNIVDELFGDMSCR